MLAARSGSGTPAANPFPDALRPGRVVALVCGGGLTNYALAMPTLSAHVIEAHGLIAVLSERRGVTEIPNAFDFITARGLATTDAIATLISAEAWDELVVVAEGTGIDTISIAEGPTTATAQRACPPKH